MNRPTSPIILPNMNEEIDYEGEPAVVIGKRGKDPSVARALEHVAGYMALNDVSARFADAHRSTAVWKDPGYIRFGAVPRWAATKSTTPP